MARLLGPDMGSRMAILPSGNPAAAKLGTVYANAGGTVLADILAYQPANPTVPGAAIAGSVVTTDAYGLLPLFWWPDAVDVVWISVDSGPITPINADYDARLDTLDAAAGHSTALRRWYAALGNRNAGITSVVVIGDSNSEGTGVTSVRRRWQQVLQSELRARFQPSGITGATMPFMPSFPRLTPVPSDYGVSTVGGPFSTTWYGLGLKALTLAAGQSVTYTFTGTGCKLYGTKISTSGRYSIVLDGAAEVVVDGAQASTAHGQMLWDPGALTAVAHTVVVSRAASTTISPGPVYPEGLMTFNGDELAGVRVVDGARHGLHVGDFSTNTAWQTALAAVPGAGLLIMPWGANDASDGTVPATFRTNLETLISTARTAGFAGSILLVLMPKRGHVSVTESVWTALRLQLLAVAAADPLIATLDLRARIPDYGTAEATTLGIYSDEVHYNDKGHGVIADQIATAIMPR